MLHGVRWILQVASDLEDREVTIPMSNHWINRIQAMRNNLLTRSFFRRWEWAREANDLGLFAWHSLWFLGAALGKFESSFRRYHPELRSGLGMSVRRSGKGIYLSWLKWESPILLQYKCPFIILLMQNKKNKSTDKEKIIITLKGLTPPLILNITMPANIAI